MYHGRNDLFPRAYDDFRSDYAHSCLPSSRFQGTNSSHKRIFRFSHLALLACTYLNARRIGWDPLDENPIYNGVRFENRPAPASLVRNLSRPGPTEAYRSNLEAMAALCSGRGIRLVLCTFAFRPERLASGYLPTTEAVIPPLEELLHRNNEAVRGVARQHELLVVETASLSALPELFRDDCHMYPAGHRRRAGLVAEALAEALR